MLKRLIEVALPLKEVSEQSAREKSIRHGHISTLHIWWARRPLAACRAVIFASLIPDPDDPECPEEFRTQVKQILNRNVFTPKNSNGASVEDTPRNRCLEFIKYLVRWENSNKPEYIEPARKLIAAAHKFLHPDSDSDAPKVLDPFAGGGAIPLEALRLGCEAHAVDLNPVAHLLELCTLVYPQKYGQPGSRTVPSYIKRLNVANRRKKMARGETDLFETDCPDDESGKDDFAPDVEITEDDYRRNPLSADVKYWGQWIVETAFRSIGDLYATGGGSRSLAYIWANTLQCPNPTCRATVPLIKQLSLAVTSRRKLYVDMLPNNERNGVEFEIREGKPPSTQQPTIVLGAMRCPVCEQGVFDKKQIKKAAIEQGLGTQRICVVSEHSERGREYRKFDETDIAAFRKAEALRDTLVGRTGDSLCPVPDELIGRDFEWVLKPPMFGLMAWGDLFNARQQVAIATIAEIIDRLRTANGFPEDDEYAAAITCYMALALDRHVAYNSICQAWDSSRESIRGTFARQAIAMSWDYCEANPFGKGSGDLTSQFRWIERVIESNSFDPPAGPCAVRRGDAQRLPFGDGILQCVITDPPYYDAVPYSDLSDFFYVWLKRSLNGTLPQLFRTPVTPKAQELVEQSAKVTPAEKRKKTKEFFEQGMQKFMRESVRSLDEEGIFAIMFAHKTTAAWEQLIHALLNAGFVVRASWPLHTELKNRPRAQKSAALASSITLICRKRDWEAGDGLWDDVRLELIEVAKERLDFFWDQGIRGADFFISAIGPALSVYGRYARVIRLSGEEVTVGEFLDEVRSLVTGYALAKILHTTNTANIDPESRFYVVWKWSYGDAKVPADESFKLAQALGIDTEEMWDKTGVLTKSGENVQCLPVEKRMKIKDLGEPDADGTPASLIDVLHRMCVFRDRGDSAGMAQFLGQSGQARNPALWLVAQAISETLPDGEREKQLMQGLLNQQEGLEEATRQGELF